MVEGAPADGDIVGILVSDPVETLEGDVVASLEKLGELLGQEMGPSLVLGITDGVALNKELGPTLGDAEELGATTTGCLLGSELAVGESEMLGASEELVGCTERLGC